MSLCRLAMIWVAMRTGFGVNIFRHRRADLCHVQHTDGFVDPCSTLACRYQTWNDLTLCPAANVLSKAAAARTTSSSECERPTICKPTGMPSGANPAQTEAAGCPVRLNGYV